MKADIILSFDELDSSHCPSGFQTYKSGKYIFSYKLVYNENTGFPSIKEAIKIVSELHVQLQFCGCSVPLPVWHVKGRNGKITHNSMLQNIPGYLRNTSMESSTPIMDDLLQRQYYKAKGRPLFSAELMRYELLLRYTSAQCYKYLQNHFPLPSFFTLNRLKQGGLDSLKALKVLQRASKISDDTIVTADEMYQQKSKKHGLETWSRTSCSLCSISKQTSDALI